MSLPNLQTLLGTVRALTTRYKAGKNPDSFRAFRDLIQLLLQATIIPARAAVRVIKGPNEKVRILGGYPGPNHPLELNDGRFLRVTMSLFWTASPQGERVKVENSSFQYQMDQTGDRWIFRYDYVREPPAPHPSSHLHLRGALTEPCLIDKQDLEDVHFPTDRVSLEAVIRLLIEQFHVPCNSDAADWRPLLAESEALFKAIAHRALSGPMQ